ncbi:hypothetical protein KF840_07155 [bacterium]|nr:hypothetical protein [bacterium]
MPKGGVETTIGHWAQPLGEVNISPQEFYAAVEAEVTRREIPGCHLSRVDWSEAGLASYKREYCRVEWREYVVDICGAPFGRSFFASSWICVPPPRLVNAIGYAVGCLAVLAFVVTTQRSVLGSLLAGLLGLLFCGIVTFGIVRPLFFPPRLTYYRVDTGQMFYSAIHQAVLQVIENLRSTHGVRVLTEAERRPVMRDYGAAAYVGPGPAAA